MNNKPNINQNFVKDIIEELKRVTWPSKQKTLRLTLIVIFISLIIGLYIGIIDILLTKVLTIFTGYR